MMTGFHPPTIHFHLGSWAVMSMSILLAFWINFLEKRGLLPRFLTEFMGYNIIQRLDFVAIITGLVGFAGILVSVWTGLVDATGLDKPNYFDLSTIILGYNTAISNEILGFKVIWTFVGMQFFIFALIIRIYFVTVQRESTIFNKPVAVQIVYVQSALVGYFIMIVIAGAGGIWISGNSILSPIPILNQFLPGGNLMVPFFLFGGLSSVIFLSSVIIKEKGVSKN